MLSFQIARSNFKNNKNPDVEMQPSITIVESIRVSMNMYSTFECILRNLHPLSIVVLTRMQYLKFILHRCFYTANTSSNFTLYMHTIVSTVTRNCFDGLLWFKNHWSILVFKITKLITMQSKSLVLVNIEYKKLLFDISHN